MSRSSWPNGLRGDNPETYNDLECAKALISGELYRRGCDDFEQYYVMKLGANAAAEIVMQ